MFDIDGLVEQQNPYDSSFDFSLLGQMLIGGRQWLCPSHVAVHAMSRSPRRIRADGLDGYYVQLQISETFKGSAGSQVVNVGPGELCVLDLTSPFALQVTTGDTICMVIPRTLLPAQAARLHGHALHGGMIRLLADYLRSLRRNVTGLTPQELPNAQQATTNVLRACFATTDDTLHEATVELDALLVNRVSGYIDRQLLSPDLSPDRICKDVGISRSRLYRLFEPTGGVMRRIQQQRLIRARDALLDPFGPHRKRIGEVAWRHGFISEKHFSRLFKHTFGCTPSEAAAQARHEQGSRGPVFDTGNPPGHSCFGDWMREVALR
ncbi:helix-turn-helix domain-containing protein [Paraburkholderia sp. J67]|uniref:helix-turn-helix domain-containing protein n=1 Tax=Paraburkholderia sp. J67 TaxID=2805435 RepID=UPI002ABD9BF6|nr:helix-turn-helix domain-containing protein [Paraburkholderia sp. J67]